MDREKIREELIGIFSEYTKIEKTKLLKNEDLRKKIDSLTLMEIIFQIEEKYKITIEDEEMIGFRNIEQVSKAILAKLEDLERTRPGE